MLEAYLKESLAKTYETLRRGGTLLTKERLADCFSRFRARFGPDVIRKLEGEELLKFMHARPNKDTLVYWLEFKNDDEFPANFGSISGGSALKFGLYFRQETGEWTRGSSKNQVNLSLTDAVALATKQRDQLIAAADLLEKLPEKASDAAYQELQKQMDILAPDVSDYAWGHKYLSLLFPTKLDDYHNPDYQRFHLIKLLQDPSDQAGLYVLAGRFVQIADELGMPINHLTTILNERNPRPHFYWRIGTSLGEQDSIWNLMRDHSFVAIGWPDLGNLAEAPFDKDLREALRQGLEKHYETVSNVASRKAGEISNFVKGLSKGDLVLAADGNRILGIGRVTSDYKFDTTVEPEAPHRRMVDWLSQESWDLPEREGLRTTVLEIKERQNLIEAERRLLSLSASLAAAVNINLSMATKHEEVSPAALNVILYGPPGTGKTYNTIERAVHVIQPNFIGDHAAYKVRFDELRSKGQIEFVTFHQSYSYEDFVEGLRPVVDPDEDAAEAHYKYCPGIFKRLAVQAFFDCLKPAASLENIVSFDALWKRLVEQMEIEPEKQYPGLTDKTSYRISLSAKGNLEGTNVLSNKTFLCTRSVLEKVFIARPKNMSVTSSDGMEVVVRGCHSHFVAAMFNELKRIQKAEFAGKIAAPTVALSLNQKAEIVQTHLRQRDSGAYVLKPQNEWPHYVLVIDEINRGNISKILGELITLIEPDKRLGAEHSLIVTLPYTGDYFAVPGNLHIVGTMNTADKSIALVDVALRRRFEFEEMRPDFLHCNGMPESMRAILNKLNHRICLRKDRDHQIGHSYFVKVVDEIEFNRVFTKHVIPLLQEYFFNDWEGLRFVLGEQGKKPANFIRPLETDGASEARTKWQWCTDLGDNNLNHLQTLVANYKAA